MDLDEPLCLRTTRNVLESDMLKDFIERERIRRLGEGDSYIVTFRRTVTLTREQAQAALAAYEEKIRRGEIAP